MSHPSSARGESPASLEALLAWVEAVWRLLATDGDANQALALALHLRELQGRALEDEGTDSAAVQALRAMLRELDYAQRRLRSQYDLEMLQAPRRY